MSSLRITASLLCGAHIATACCREDPPTPPDLDSISQWEHLGTGLDDAACASSIELEPNDGVVESNVIGAHSGCASRVITASVAGDADAFYLWGEPCGTGPPGLSLLSGPEDLRFCLFVACSVGRTGFDSDPCPGSTSYRTAEGLLGCCGTKSETVSVHINCDSEFTPLGHVPEFDGYVVVDRKSSVECTDYSLSVHL